MRSSIPSETLSAGPSGFRHIEAFCLMEYASDDGREIEFIWNSRDGVTPFVVTSRLGTEMCHVNWRHDRRIFDFHPQPGSRIFVDLTPERAREIAAHRIERSWDAPVYPASAHWATKEEAIDELVRDLFHMSLIPDIKVVE